MTPHHRQLVLLAAPAWTSIACLAAAQVCPEQRVWTHVLKAVLLSAPCWVMLLWAPWCGLCFATWRRRGTARPSATWIAVLGLVGLVLAGIPEFPPSDIATGLKVVSANVNAYSDTEDSAPLEAALSELKAGVLITIEERAHNVVGMTRVADNYEEDLPRISHGTAVFCRDPVQCDARITEEFGSDHSRMPLALVRLTHGVQRPICLLGIHSPPPAPFDTSGIGPYISTIASHLEDGSISTPWNPCQRGDDAVVLGDMNAVPWSTAWRALRATGLTDVLRWRGIYASSWPAGGGWPNLPLLRLDHLLVGTTDAQGVHLQRIPGSDHKALVAWLK